MSVVSGALVSTVKVRFGGFVSTLKTSSRARTVNVCGPSGSGVVVTGLLQLGKTVPSSWHSNVAPGPLRKVKTGVLSLVGPDGPAVMTVVGGVTSWSS